MKKYKLIILMLFTICAMPSYIYAQADTPNYTKDQVNRAIRIALDSVYQKLQVDVFLNLKADKDSVDAKFDTVKTKGIIIDDGVQDPATITATGGVSGEAGVKVGETVQVEGSSPTVGFILGANISDLHPPSPMTGSWDWHMFDQSGFVASTQHIQDSLAQRDSLIEYLRHDAFFYTLQDTASLWVQNKILLRTPWNITIDSVAAVITGGTHVDMNFSHTNSMAVEGNQVFAEEQRITSKTVGDVITAFNSNAVDRNRWLFLSISAVEGAVTQLSFIIYYRKN